MIIIRPLMNFEPERFRIVASGYTTTEIFRVTHADSASQTTFSLDLETLPQPGEFRFPYSLEDLERYGQVVHGPFCLGAYDEDLLVGIALAETQEWNQTLWVWEFHVAEAYRGQGIGRNLMDQLARLATEAGLRAIICETQNTNVPAIRFYRAVGFGVEGVDVSYYTNEDMLPGHTVAVFMKRRLK